ncbi:hypothetical protein Plhal710r2_c016g0073191 [Plasmopara halstedii]
MLTGFDYCNFWSTKLSKTLSIVLVISRLFVGSRQRIIFKPSFTTKFQALQSRVVLVRHKCHGSIVHVETSRN